MTLLDSTSSTPFFAAIESKSVVSHINGTCDIPAENVPHQITHWELFRYFARFDRASYPRVLVADQVPPARLVVRSLPAQERQSVRAIVAATTITRGDKRDSLSRVNPARALVR